MLSYLDPGSQPLNPTTALMLRGYGMPFAYLPIAKHVAEYKAVAAPMLKPPIPTFTVTKNLKSTGLFNIKIL